MYASKICCTCLQRSYNETLQDNVTLPQKIPDSKLWKCDRVHPNYMHVFFPCNFEINCQNKADEKDCPYTGRCPIGMIASERYLKLHHVLSLSFFLNISNEMQKGKQIIATNI